MIIAYVQKTDLKTFVDVVHESWKGSGEEMKEAKKGEKDPKSSAHRLGKSYLNVALPFSLTPKQEE
jgi:hypothetical protein